MILEQSESGSHAEIDLGGLLDDPEFHQLDKRLGRFNLFEAVGGVRAELRHSNFLGFILSPIRSHGLGPLVLEQVVRAILETMPREDRPIRTLELVLADLDDAVVHRERENIDLLIDFPSLKMVVTIENKVGSAAGDGQLARYKAIIDHRFPKYRRLFVFLTPDGTEPECPGWIAFSYRRLAEVLSGIAEMESVPDGPSLILNHYTEMLRRHVVPDDNLRALALRLYERHREAFDFVFEAKPQPKSILDELRLRILAVDGIMEDRSHANNFRFLPQYWDDRLQVLQCDLSKWTHTGRGLMFEAKTYPNGRVHVALVLGPCDPEVRKAFHNEVLKRAAFKGATKSPGQSWATIYNRDLLTAAQASQLDFDQRLGNVMLAWSEFQGLEFGTLNAEVEAIVAQL